MILWSTAEAVLRQTCFIDRCLDCVDPMVYCGSGTETHKVFMLIVYIMIL